MDKKIPDLMPFQMQPFNGDTYIEEQILELQETFQLSKAIELGTCLGSTALWLAKHFNLVHTIEINEEYHNIAQKRILDAGLKGDHTVCNWHGDSTEVLPRIFSYEVKEFMIKERCFIFIDSHWGDNVPLLKELQIISESKLKPVIAIHDFMVPGTPELGYDCYHGQPFTFEWIRSGVENIYGKDGFKYYYNRIATGAKRGIIYIYPKM